MKSNYKTLGNFIREVVNINNELSVTNLRGISSIYKEFIDSKANIVGVEFDDYKIVKTGQFAYNPNTARMGDKIPIALNSGADCIVSKIYPVFEVVEKSRLLPEYLMLWFRRPEFDRYARFMSHGSAREVFSWEEMCNVELPVPSIEKQKEVIKEYNTVIDRVNLNNNLIFNFEETIRTLYNQWFVDFEFPDENGLLYKSNDGNMEYCKELDKEIPQNWKCEKIENVCVKIGSGATPRGGKESYYSEGISLIRSQNVYDYVFSLDNLAFIDEEQAKGLSNVTVELNDILINITGVSVARCCKVPKYILPARVNQHVMIIRPDKKLYLSNYLLCLLCHTDNKSRLLGISQSGSTREAITKTEIENFLFLAPPVEIVKKFDKVIQKIIDAIELKILENSKLLDLTELLLAKIANLEVID